ncbi:IPT/TIG domain-containing protein [Nocardia gipuzkoensis]
MFMAPTITSLSPTAGPPAGGNNVTITGTGFTFVTTVRFGTLATTSPSTPPRRSPPSPHPEVARCPSLSSPARAAPATGSPTVMPGSLL